MKINEFGYEKKVHNEKKSDECRQTHDPEKNETR